MWWLIAAIGAGVGFVAGLFGAEDRPSARRCCTPRASGVLCARIAPAGCHPLGASASIAYWRTGLIDRQLFSRTLWFAMPATVAGALITPLIGGNALVATTEVLVVLIGLRLLIRPALTAPESTRAEPALGRVAILALVVGVIAGLLGNSGGFLFAPLFVLVLRVP